MSRREENRAFICIHCGQHVLSSHDGSYRNHCPFCLVSLHVDIQPGDRANDCKGLMLPKKLIYKNRKWQILHVCSRCGEIKANRVAEGSVQPDVFEALIRLSQFY